MTSRPTAPLQPPQERRRSTRQRQQAANTLVMAATAGHDAGDAKKWKKKKQSKNTRSDAHQCTCQQDSSSARDVADSNHHHVDGGVIATADEAGNCMDGSSSSSSDKKGKGRDLSSSSSSSYQIVGSHQTLEDGVDDGRIPRSSSSNAHGSRPVKRGRKRLLSSREPSPPGLDRTAYSPFPSYLASASTLPWAIGANDDALPSALAFRFVRNGNIDGNKLEDEANSNIAGTGTSSSHRRTQSNSSNGRLQ